MSEAGPVLRLEAVGFVLGGARVLDQVSLTLHPGERLAIVGRNGSGKSSLTRLVTGLAQPANGHIRLFGADTRAVTVDEGRRLRGRIGMVLQGGSLLADLSVEDNLRLGLGAQRAANLRRRRTQLDRALLNFRLEALGARIVDSLSTGERRRVELARAFLRDPELLVLDDPFEGADAAVAEDLEARTVSLLARRPRAMLLLTRSEVLARRLAPTVLTLERGCLS